MGTNIYSEQFVTPIGRVSYPRLKEARLQKDNKTLKYEVELIFGADADLSNLTKVVKETAERAFGKSVNPHKLMLPLKNGDEHNDEAYKGHKFVRLKSTRPIKCIGRARQDIDPETIYAGCYARALVSAGSFDQANKGVTLIPHAIQFIRDGEPLGGTGVVRLEAFDVLEDVSEERAEETGWGEGDDIPF